jgi:ABC transporter substrate binding protein (PQQ-dependent alcohol dehydrogenase system)
MLVLLRVFALSFFIALMCGLSFAQPGISVRILYAEQQFDRPPALSNLRPVPGDLGLAGAHLGLSDNLTAGKFLGQDYVLTELVSPPQSELVNGIRPKLREGYDLIILNAPASAVLAVADLPEARSSLLFNIASRDESLREEDCRFNLLHIIPSRSMITDALAQFFVKKQWPHWFLIAGSRDNDKAYADSIRRSATKFGIAVVGETNWETEADMRESASLEIPLMTQDGEYDAVVVADENDDFDSLIPFNTWLPRPVAGTHGLVATGWSHVVEPWGAVQLQNRFRSLAGRDMQEVDFAAWLAVRIIGEATTRAGKADSASLRHVILSPDFQMSAFKGRGLTFREWNGQLRQPIHLVTADAQVAVAPLEGFLHENTDLDTLGSDRPQTKCTRFEGGPSQ